jgi:hypothetical protein
MAITIDWINKIVNSTSSILDLPSFKDTIRDLEDDAIGMLYPPVITYKRIDLGGGAYFHAVDFINGYQLRFPNAGSYEIVGNLNANIIPVSGVFIERKTSAAFATSSTGGGGSSQAPTVEEIRQEMDANSVKLLDINTMVEELWKLQGLDPLNPMTVTTNSRTAGDINLDLTGNGETLTVVTRND